MRAPGWRRWVLLVGLTGLACGLGERLRDRRAAGGGGGGGGGGGSRRERREERREDRRGDRVDDLSEIWGGDGCGEPTRTGRVVWQVDFGGETYGVTTWIPPGAGPRDAVIALHGHNGGGASFGERSGFADLVAEKGFVLVAPDAVMAEGPDPSKSTRTWNNHRMPPDKLKYGRDDAGSSTRSSSACGGAAASGGCSARASPTARR